MSTTAPNLSDRIKQARREADMSQRQLADLIGVSVAAVQAWEQGQRKQPRPGALTRVADVTNKPLSWFFEEVPA